MTTGLSASPTTEIWPKVWEIRGAVAADAENPMARVCGQHIDAFAACSQEADEQGESPGDDAGDGE